MTDETPVFAWDPEKRAHLIRTHLDGGDHCYDGRPHTHSCLWMPRLEAELRTVLGISAAS